MKMIDEMWREVYNSTIQLIQLYNFKLYHYMKDLSSCATQINNQMNHMNHIKWNESNE